MGRPKGSKNKPKGKIIDPLTGAKRSYTMTAKALAQRRERMALTPAESEEEKNYNARQIEHVLNIHKIAANADRSDLASLKSCFIAYLQLCQEDGFKISNLGAYAAMGMSKQLFEQFKHKDDPDIKEFVSMIQTTCAIARETMIADSKINPVIGIFWQRNFDGLRNDTEQVQAAQEMEDDYGGNKSYKEKYKNLIGG